MWDRGWGTLKLAYLYLQYWVVGLDEEAFQITKGNSYSDDLRAELVRLEEGLAKARADRTILGQLQNAGRDA